MRRVLTITLALAFLATVPVFAGGDAAEYGDGVTIDAGRRRGDPSRLAG